MQQSRGRRKSRAVGRLGKASDPLRTPYPHLLIEDDPGNLPRSVQLTGSAGQHDAAAGDLVEPARLKAIAHQLERLLDPRGDDPDEQRSRHMVDLSVLLLADWRDGD